MQYPSVYFRAVLLGTGLAVGWAPATLAQQPAATFGNPLGPDSPDSPDPWVTRYGGYYYYTNTTGSNSTLWKTKALSAVQQAPGTVVWTPPPATGLLVYSASTCWDDNYCLGMFSAPKGSDSLQPASWTKAPQPVFQPSAENGVGGTEHNCFITSPDGRENWLVYYAKSAPDGKCAGRNACMQRFIWNPDGTPRFGVPVPLVQPQAKPSGE